MPKMVLVGNGVMGSRHMARLSKMGAEFTCVLDPGAQSGEFSEGNSEAQKKFAQGNAKGSVKFVKSNPEEFGEARLREFIKADCGEVDAAVIAAPASFHAFYAREFLKEGISVFVEKPLATTAKEARELAHLALDSGTLLFPGYSEKFHPAFRQLMADLEEPLGKGEFRFVRKNQGSARGRDVPATLDLLVHDLDMLFHICGKIPRMQLLEVQRLDSETACFTAKFGQLKAHFDISRRAKAPERSVFAKVGERVLGANFLESFPAPDALEAEHAAFLSQLATKKNSAFDILCAVKAVACAEKLNKLMGQS